MRAISKSGPIVTKLCTHHSRLNSVRCAKFRNLTNIMLDLIKYAVPNFVQIERYLGTLVHHLHKIGRKYIWELYLNLNRFSRNLTHITLDLYTIPNFVQIERYIGTLVHHLPKIGQNYTWQLYLYLNRFSRNLAHIILDLIK